IYSSEDDTSDTDEESSSEIKDTSVICSSQTLLTDNSNVQMQADTSDEMENSDNSNVQMQADTCDEMEDSNNSNLSGSSVQSFIIDTSVYQCQTTSKNESCFTSPEKMLPRIGPAQQSLPNDASKNKILVNNFCGGLPHGIKAVPNNIEEGKNILQQKEYIIIVPNKDNSICPKDEAFIASRKFSNSQVENFDSLHLSASASSSPYYSITHASSNELHTINIHTLKSLATDVPMDECSSNESLNKIKIISENKEEDQDVLQHAENMDTGYLNYMDKISGAKVNDSGNSYSSIPLSNSLHSLIVDDSADEYQILNKKENFCESSDKKQAISIPLQPSLFCYIFKKRKLVDDSTKHFSQRIAPLKICQDHIFLQNKNLFESFIKAQTSAKKAEDLMFLHLFGSLSNSRLLNDFHMLTINSNYTELSHEMSTLTSYKLINDLQKDTHIRSKSKNSKKRLSNQMNLQNQTKKEKYSESFLNHSKYSSCINLSKFILKKLKAISTRNQLHKRALNLNFVDDHNKSKVLYLDDNQKMKGIPVYDSHLINGSEKDNVKNSKESTSISNNKLKFMNKKINITQASLSSKNLAKIIFEPTNTKSQEKVTFEENYSSPQVNNVTVIDESQNISNMSLPGCSGIASNNKTNNINEFDFFGNNLIQKLISKNSAESNEQISDKKDKEHEEISSDASRLKNLNKTARHLIKNNALTYTEIKNNDAFQTEHQNRTILNKKSYFNENQIQVLDNNYQKMPVASREEEKNSAEHNQDDFISNLPCKQELNLSQNSAKIKIKIKNSLYSTRIHTLTSGKLETVAKSDIMDNSIDLSNSEDEIQIIECISNNECNNSPQVSHRNFNKSQKLPRNGTHKTNANSINTDIRPTQNPASKYSNSAELSENKPITILNTFNFERETAPSSNSVNLKRPSDLNISSPRKRKLIQTTIKNTVKQKSKLIRPTIKNSVKQKDEDIQYLGYFDPNCTIINELISID
ncbi:hypothetical protein CEXT_55781, partial [Caerostris extrusa]